MNQESRMKNVLKIDTSDNLVTLVELEKDGKRFRLEEKRGKPGDQNVLVLIEKLLKEQGLSLKDISSLKIKTGPGSFTGLRVGVAIANALSFGLHVSVNGKPLGELVEPHY